MENDTIHKGRLDEYSSLIMHSWIDFCLFFVFKWYNKFLSMNNWTILKYWMLLHHWYNLKIKKKFNVIFNIFHTSLFFIKKEKRIAIYKNSNMKLFILYNIYSILSYLLINSMNVRMKPINVILTNIFYRYFVQLLI